MSYIMTAAASSLDDITPPLGYIHGKRVFNLIVFYRLYRQHTTTHTQILS